MTALIIKDQVAEGLSQLITQWLDKPNVVGLLTSYLENVQDVEEALFQLLDERSLYTAIGVQLDVLGLLVGEARQDKTDEDYRSALTVRIAINRSDGTEPVVSSLMKQLSGADVVTYTEVYPAGVKFKLEGPSVIITPEVLGELRNILAATITAQLEFVSFINPPFVFLNDSDGEGFSDVGTSIAFRLVTHTGAAIATDTSDILTVNNPDIVLDPESFAGGYLADLITTDI